jgi:seryl-tRNA synthetase
MAEVTPTNEEINALELKEAELEQQIKKILMIIPNIIDPSFPIGKDDSENV